MKATTHTPGPWEVDGYRIGQPVGQHGLNLVAKVLQTPDASEDAANARLIAAAPDLLAVARRVVAGGMSFPRCDRELAAAAIAKAEGAAD